MDERLDETRRAEATHFWFRGFRRFVAPVLREAAAGRPGLRLIDCGCGVGQNLLLMRPLGRAFGLELTAAAAAQAGTMGPVAQADITRIPFLPDQFDIVTSFDVVQCVEDDGAAVREMVRVLRPGGTLLLTVAAFDVLSGDHAEIWHEFRRYTPASAGLLAERAGLQVERVQFMFASLFPLMLAVRTIQRLVRPLRAGPGHADIAVPWGPVNTALTWLLRGEATLTRRFRMPIGSSLLVVAKKP